MCRFNRIRSWFLMVIALCIMPKTYGLDTTKWVKLLLKYEKRGLPQFRHPDLILELEERSLENNATDQILAGRYIKYREMVDLERRNQQLPWFIGFIPIANTGFEPRFRNTSGYAGPWPLPYLIAKKYKLVQTALYDERHEIKQSTVAACRYLTDLNHIYKDWLLTITAFSIGPARLNQVLHGTKSLNFDTVYNALEADEKIPVIQFMSSVVRLSELMEMEQNFPDTVLAPLVKVTSIPHVIPFSIFSEYFDIGIAQMRQYNPGLKADLIPYMGAIFEFRLPASKADLYRSKKDSILYWLKGAPEIEITYDTVMKVFDGDSVLVVESLQQVEEPQIISSGVHHNTPKVWVYYTVKRGDALYTITDIFDCTAQDIRHWNPSKSKNFLVVGRRLKFHVPASKKAYYQEIDAMSLTQKRARATSK
jgi:LysM repeat protein